MTPRGDPKSAAKAKPSHEGPSLVAFLGSADLRLQPVAKAASRSRGSADPQEPEEFRLVWTGDRFAGDGWTAVPRTAGDGRMDLEARRDGGQAIALLRAADGADPALASDAHLDPFAPRRRA